jgi:SnoaL-like domain
MDVGSEIDGAATQGFFNFLCHCAGMRVVGVGSTVINLLTKEALDEIAASAEPICPTINDQGGRSIGIFAARKTFSSLLGKNLDWQAITDQARRLSREKDLEHKHRRIAEMETKILPIEQFSDIPQVMFARIWSAAWSSRDLELLLSLFGENGLYEDKRFDRQASGRAALRELFATAFHASDMSLIVKGIGLSPDSTVFDWIRTGTRLMGVELPRRYEFWGQSVVRFTSNRVLSCEETWNVGDGLMYVLANMRRTPRAESRS